MSHNNQLVTRAVILARHGHRLDDWHLQSVRRLRDADRQGRHGRHLGEGRQGSDAHALQLLRPPPRLHDRVREREERAAADGDQHRDPEDVYRPAKISMVELLPVCEVMRGGHAAKFRMLADAPRRAMDAAVAARQDARRVDPALAAPEVDVGALAHLAHTCVDAEPPMACRDGSDADAHPRPPGSRGARP